jgi:hypothetical protein
MKAERLSTEIAALERQSGKAKNAVLKKVLAKKIEKLKTELESITSEQTANDKIKKAKTKVNAMNAKEFNAYIKDLAKNPDFSFLKSMTSSEIVRDMKRTAKPVGWRFRGRSNSKTPTKKDIKDKNNVYYEGRRNRSDVSRKIRLKDGGGVGENVNSVAFDELKKGDKIKITFKSISQNSNEKTLLVKSKNLVGKGKSYESEKITFTNIENPTGVNYFAYKRKDGNVSFAIGDSAIMGVKIIQKFAGGGGVDINDWDMPVIRTQFEDEEYEYAQGGETGEPHRTKINGMMAKGGAIQHGLKVGDKIVADQFWENSIVVENGKTNKRAVVYLETGKRKEA